MIESWRWYGPEDPVPLAHIRQAGATGVVTALHHLYDGRGWSLDDVLERKALVEAAGLQWTVCESIPVLSSIKLADKTAATAIANWKASLRSLGQGGVPVVCFNFMPLVDWTRTELRYERPDSGLALRFDMVDFVAYDVFGLKRKDAAASYPVEIVAAAERRFAATDEAARERIEANIIKGLPGGEGRYTRADFEVALAEFSGITEAELRANLIAFLREVVPVAEEVGVKLVVHPDDPPFSLFGLPRVVSTSADIRALLGAVDSPANNICLCTGSYGSRPDNDPAAMVREFGPRIQFAHLRNVTRDADGSFAESGHIEGDVDMVEVIAALLDEEARRAREGLDYAQIPIRSDHGHLLLDDIDKERINPGYSAIGRLKGLAELRGIAAGLSRRRA